MLAVNIESLKDPVTAAQSMFDCLIAPPSEDGSLVVPNLDFTKVNKLKLKEIFLNISAVSGGVTDVRIPPGRKSLKKK